MRRVVCSTTRRLLVRCLAGVALFCTARPILFARFVPFHPAPGSSTSFLSVFAYRSYSNAAAAPIAPPSSSSSSSLPRFLTTKKKVEHCCSLRPDSSATGFFAALQERKIMERISSKDEVGGAGGAYSYSALKRLDNLWSSICASSVCSFLQKPKKVNQVVFEVPGPRNPTETQNVVSAFDILVCGGTLGIFIATTLAMKGLKVGVVERNQIKGREQEWNISKKEVQELVEVGILLEEELDQIIVSDFNPVRCGFQGKDNIWVEDILNIGISPMKLIDIVKRRFIALGGIVMEGKSITTIHTYDDMSIVRLADGELMSSRLIIDSMGNFSPIVKQIRSSRKPDGVCVVVGACSRGFIENKSGDIIFSSSSVKKVGDAEVQYFWEAFPAGSGPTDRTVYMFTYVDASPGAPKLEELLEDFWDLFPIYQGVELHDLEIIRVIFGIFPTYRDSPLPAAFNRIIQVGDASGIQSPVSFGGFGSLTRHIGRLSNGIYEAVTENFLDADSLSLLNSYLPNLSASWLFQRAMSARHHSDVSPTFINELLYANFQGMKKLGDPVLRPFLQDVVKFGPLAKTLGLVMLTQPMILPSIFKQVGVGVILDWSAHFVMLGYYTFLSTYIDPVIRPWLQYLPRKKRYEWKRYLEAWKYGSGLDYKLK